MEIEIGDFVEIIAGDCVGFVGILDNVFKRHGVVNYTVIDETDNDDFYYATEIKLFKKG